MKAKRQIITLDFETAYDTDYSLTKMTTAQYILDDRFEVIGVGVKVNQSNVKWHSADFPILKKELAEYPWENSIVVAHNAIFDGAILEWIFNIRPWRYFCTMMGCRPFVTPHTGRMDLATTVQHEQLGKKLAEVHRVKGMWRKDFDPEALLRYAAYCLRDVQLAYLLFCKYYPKLPQFELDSLDLTIKKFTRPKLRLDRKVLFSALKEERKHKKDLMLAAGIDDRGVLLSNAQFAGLIREKGYEPPLKKSPTTGQDTYAFAKDDPGLLMLRDKPDLRPLIDARLAVKSTINETRLDRFLGLSEVTELLPAPLLFWGAHTGRFSGLDKLNLQNLTRGGALRKALVAGPGRKIIAADLRQIEARILACLAGQEDLLTQFRDGEDVYCSFASEIYGRVITKDDPAQRFVGKTCILGLGYGMGFRKFHERMLIDGIFMDSDEARRIVLTYRTRFQNILILWRSFENAIRVMHSPNLSPIVWGPVIFEWQGIILPEGMKVQYPNLRLDKAGQYTYRKGREVKSLYGGKVTENVVQALAQIILKEAEVRMAKQGLLAALQVHDELVFVVRDEKVEQASAIIHEEMTRKVKWMPGLPVDCEINVGDNYADAK